MNNKKKNNNTILIVGVVLLVILILLALWFFVLKGNNKESNKDNKADNQNVDVIDTDGKYDDTKGVLHQVKDDQSFIIKGMYLVGDERDDPEYMDQLNEKGYSKSNLKTTFKKNEWINIYLDTDYSSEDGFVKVFIVPHRDFKNYQDMDISLLQSETIETGGYYFSIYEPDSRNYNFVGNGFVSNDAKSGDYDILFVNGSEIVYYVVIEVK